MVTPPGMAGITTEIFFKNTEYLGSEAVFGVRHSLIADLKPA